MDDLSLFSILVERIYDASLDEALWPEALERICAFVMGCSIVLYYKSVGTTFTSLFHSWGLDPLAFQLYQEKYSELDPLFPAALFLEVGEVHTIAELIPIDEFRLTRLYKEWVRPQGILDAMHSNLERTTTGAAALVIHGRERDGLFDSGAKARFELVIPHVRRAIAIGKIVDFQKANEFTLGETLDSLEAAVLLVASNGRLVYANAAAAAMLTKADVLRASSGRLAAVVARIDAELQDAIGRAARGDTALGVQGIAISIAANDQGAQVAHVLSLASGKRRGQFISPAVAAVFVRKIALPTPTPFEIIAKTYSLTAGEVRVLTSLAASTGVADMARMLGIGESTVKTHLNRLFSKTGAKRQADLVKLLARYGSALGRDAPT